ncbi:MAG: SPOR domain-containing protein [Desulfobacteraceae bacterium]|nr:SPOR domain-containing protein [Desulfobacteraceae bacterium]MCF8094994.1 SPOR domain-containing protein [Desulfobacteraceae bacterium]
MGFPHPKNRDTGPRGSTSGWLVLLLAASASMFIIGVLVGRNTAPVYFDMENLDKKLSELESSVLADKKDAQSSTQKSPDDISFEFYDKLKEKTTIDEHEAGRPRVLAPKYEKPDPSEIEPARAAAGKKVQPAEPERTPASEPPGKQYAIQVASLRDPEKAKQVRNKFSAKGYPVFTQMAVVEGKGRWYRVRLGPYTGRNQAKDDLSRLQKAGVDAILLLND